MRLLIVDQVPSRHQLEGDLGASESVKNRPCQVHGSHFGVVTGRRIAFERPFAHVCTWRARPPSDDGLPFESYTGMVVEQRELSQLGVSFRDQRHVTSLREPLTAT
jgi:hypothetical protein